MTRSRTVARALGLFSLALGLVELLTPRRFARWAGVGARGQENAVRAIGARELGSAIGLLGRPMPVSWSWLRVGGDAMDLALLGRLARQRGMRRDRLTAALGAVAAVSVLDLVASLRLSRLAGAPARAARRAHARERETAFDGATPVRASVTVDRSPEEVYALWRDFEAFPQFMRHVEKVDVSADGRRSHWTAKAPAGSTVEWDAILTDDRPNELISWRSVPGTGVHNAGAVRFTPAPAGRGTEVHVEMEYAAPAGALGTVVATLFGEEPSQQVREDIGRFKQIAEVGEVVRSEATGDAPHAVDGGSAAADSTPGSRDGGAS